jgi:hypothetical protein
MCIPPFLVSVATCAADLLLALTGNGPVPSFIPHITLARRGPSCPSKCTIPRLYSTVHHAGNEARTRTEERDGHCHCYHRDLKDGGNWPCCCRGAKSSARRLALRPAPSMPKRERSIPYTRKTLRTVPLGMDSDLYCTFVKNKRVNQKIHLPVDCTVVEGVWRNMYTFQSAFFLARSRIIYSTSARSRMKK